MFRYAFRILGAPWERRCLVDAAVAHTGYAACDPRAEVNKEAYLSAFWFADDFRRLLESTGSTAGFNGRCWGPFLWWDIDRENDPDAALLDARKLAGSLLERYPALDDDDLLLFYSGSKGFHVGLPTTIWAPKPSLIFNRVARYFAEHIAQVVGVNIDASIYDKVRAFRAPNSRHSKTGRYKRRLSHDELMGLSLPRIVEMAEQPKPFDLPAPHRQDERAIADWRDAERSVAEAIAATTRRRPATNGRATLNRLTMDFIRDGAPVGHRHRLLFSAAANLAEFGCPPALAHALLSEAALDTGLMPKDVHRQIECGFAHVAAGHAGDAAGDDEDAKDATGPAKGT